MNLIVEDWKQQVMAKLAASAKNISDDDIEIAFSEQAWTQIQNKLKPLAKDEYRLGFEIVWKDDNNTKMVGLFAFRTGKQLLYAPVFFINGNIKGTDLLYRENVKSFVPATHDWAKYLISKAETEQGKGEQMSTYDRNSKQMDINDIAFNPVTGRGGMKRASFTQAFVDIMGLMKVAHEEQSPVKSLLQKQGSSMFEHLSNWILGDEKFAEQFHATVPESDWLDLEFPITTIKQASTTKPAGIRVFKGYNTNVPQEKRAGHIKQGYSFEDTRPDSSIEPIYEDMTVDISSIDEGGIYDLMTLDGLKKVFAAPKVPYESCINNLHSTNQICCDDDNESGYFDYDNRKKQRFLVIDFGNKSSRVCTNIYGMRADSENKDLESMFKDKPEVGKCYYIYEPDSGKILSDLLYVSGISNVEEGVTNVEYHSSSWISDTSTPKVVKINTHLESPVYLNKVLTPSKNKWIEVKCDIKTENGHTSIDEVELEYAPGDAANLDVLLTFNNYKKATVIKSDSVDGYYTLSFGEGDTIRDISRPDAVYAIMKSASVRQETAEEVLGVTDARGYYELTLRKQAGSKLVFDQIDPGMFNNISVNEFGYSEQPYQEAQLVGTSGSMLGNNVQFYNNATTDERNVSGRNQDLMGATPMQLFEMSQTSGDRSVFEHGVVGQLVKTYDSGSLIQEYIPDLLQALDKLGRSLFLFYWKPEDFSEFYGSDDVSDMQNMFQTSFLSFGELVLDLIQRHPEGYTETLIS
jgi:hypothetical protein